MQRSIHDLRGMFVYVLTAAILGIGILAGVAYFLSHAQPVEANSSFFALATGQYPSIVGTRIGNCSLCHTASIPALNSYGQAFLSHGASSAALAAIESLDSDGDGFTNIQEINALTYPGDPGDRPAAPTATNTPFQPATPTNTAMPPSATPTNTAMPPTAMPTNTGMPPTTMPTNTSMAPTDMPTDVSPTNVPPTEVPPTSVPPTQAPPTQGGLDLDIQGFKVSEEFKLEEPRPIQIRIDIRNRSQVNGQGTLTVSAIQNGTQVYSQTISVSDAPGDGPARYTLPEYTPTSAGVIRWTASLTDDNPDNDVAMAVTKVSSEKKDDGGDDHHGGGDSGGGSGGDDHDGSHQGNHDNPHDRNDDSKPRSKPGNP